MQSINLLSSSSATLVHAESIDAKVKTRSSNLELYRIVCMLMIVSHHYVVNSGLCASDGPIVSNPLKANSVYLALFGAWGKVGINCFMLITGYFMCNSQITIRKFLKLISQIEFYHLLLFPILLITGYETLSFKRLIKVLMPVWDFSNNFVSCFLVFWLTIPFWNILVRNMSKRQHELLLLLLLLLCYTLLGSVPGFKVTFNYITWFGVVYLISSYIRLYPAPMFERKHLWAWMTVIMLILASASIIGMQWLLDPDVLNHSFFFVRDSNKLFAVAFSICSFLWFKNIDIKYSKIINAFGAGTFGVLLIHANSDAMRTWLWKDTVDCVGQYSLPLGNLILYSSGVVLTIFVICNLIDQLRINTLEKWFFNWYDKKYAAKANAFVNGLINGKQ